MKRIKSRHQSQVRPGTVGGWKGFAADVLKINFSVGVSMYSEKVTSYWYFFSCSQRVKDDMYDALCSRVFLA